MVVVSRQVANTCFERGISRYPAFNRTVYFLKMSVKPARLPALNGLAAKVEESLVGGSTAGTITSWTSNENVGKDGKREEETAEPSSIFLMFCYSSLKDRVLTAIGCLVALGAGTAIPVLIVLIGKIIRMLVIFQSLVPQLCNNQTSAVMSLSYVTENTTEVITTERFLHRIEVWACEMALVGLIILVSNAVAITSLDLAATKQCFRIRQNLMRTILHQDMSWFDRHGAKDFSGLFTKDLEAIQEGLGEKLGLCCLYASTAAASTVSAVWHGWELTLVLLALPTLLGVVSAAVAKLQAKLQSGELWAYRNADSVVEAVICSIKTVIAYGGQEKEVKRYEDRLEEVQASATRRGVAAAAISSLTWVFIYASYALGFWYGVLMLAEDLNRPPSERLYDAGSLVTVLFSVLTATLSVGQATSYWGAIPLAKRAAKHAYSYAQLKPQLDSSATAGLKPDNLDGTIQMKSINFSYPSGPAAQVLRNFSLNISSGQCVALVGDPGCGKTTVLNLLQRFYDVKDGEIMVDDRDIKWYNVGWLRGQLGVVSQEPVLFSTTVGENIRYGLASATQADIQEAAIMANAHDFIVRLPKKYDTMIGEYGHALSGSQVRRIAIARALVRNPKILLLDDPVALIHEVDAVQAALLKAREGRTTLITSSRLSTVRMANKILVLKNGRVVDKGSHKALVKKGGGPYMDLLRAETAGDKNADMAQSPQAQSTASCSSAVQVHEGDNIAQKAGLASDTGDDFPWKHILLLARCQSSLLLICGCILALLMAFHVPAYALVLGDTMQRISSGRDGPGLRGIFHDCLLFLLIGILTGICSFLQASIFSAMGAKLTRTLRKLVFAGVLRQSVSWIDVFEGGSGALSRNLFARIDAIQRVVCFRLAVSCQALSTFVACAVLSFYWNAILGLIVFAFVPLSLVFTYVESRVAHSRVASSRKSLEPSTKAATEAILNIRTVASLHQEEIFCAKYLLSLAEAQSITKRMTILRGITYGVNQCIPCLAYAISLYYGSLFVSKCNLNAGDLIKIVEGVILGTAVMGQAVTYSKSSDEARTAATAIFQLLDRCSTADLFDEAGTVLDNLKGSLLVKEVSFRYPNQPETEALKRVTFSAEPGQTVALLGPKLSGKTACLDLVERFHDVTEGEILLDGLPTTALNLTWMRRQLGYVCDPALISGYTIAENIAYGDSDRDVSRNEVLLAAQKAEAHHFILRLPEGYDTVINGECKPLTRGQMRRIALARALLRDPKILLIDDTATGHEQQLDEEAIQESVPDRTCVVVANKASAVMEADRIFVLHRGRVVERGCHDELMSRKGIYYRMFKEEGTDVDIAPEKALHGVKFSIVQDEFGEQAL